MDTEGDKLNFKLLAPPSYLPTLGSMQDKNVSYFGCTNFVQGLYSQKEIFGLKRADRNRHMYVIGKSGMGKSCLLEQLIRFDIAGGYGVAVIDPHGDLAKNLLEFIPDKRINDTIYIDPGNTDKPIAFNPFASVPSEFRQIVTRELIEIFKKQFESNWSARIEHVFRFATLATLEDPEGTLYGLMQMLIDSDYRKRVVEHISDEVVRRFFTVEYAAFSQKYDQEAITPLVNRLGQFFADPLMRAIFSQKENKIDFDDIMNNGRVLIFNASKGTLGEENSAFFASFFLTKISQTAMARTKISQDKRKDFYLYVDEFQNVANKTFSTLFSESRKYGVNITVANQYLSQIPVELMESVFGNIGTLISFRIGGADAQRLVQEFQPLVESEDLINLGMREFYIKMAIDGKTSQPFSAVTIKLPAIKNIERGEKIKKCSIDKYSRDMIKEAPVLAPIPNIATEIMERVDEEPSVNDSFMDLPPPV